MPPVGFDPTIPAGERPQTYALDRAATRTCYKQLISVPIKRRDVRFEWAVFSQITKISYFTVPQNSTQCSEEPANCSSPEPAESSPCLFYVTVKTHINTLEFIPRSPKWSVTFGFPHQNPVGVSLLPHNFYMYRPSHPFSIYVSK